MDVGSAGSGRQENDGEVSGAGPEKCVLLPHFITRLPAHALCCIQVIILVAIVSLDVNLSRKNHAW